MPVTIGRAQFTLPTSIQTQQTFRDKKLNFSAEQLLIISCQRLTDRTVTELWYEGTGSHSFLRLITDLMIIVSEVNFRVYQPTHPLWKLESVVFLCLLWYTLPVESFPWPVNVSMFPFFARIAFGSSKMCKLFAWYPILVQSFWSNCRKIASFAYTIFYTLMYVYECSDFKIPKGYLYSSCKN